MSEQPYYIAHVSGGEFTIRCALSDCHLFPRLVTDNRKVAEDAAALLCQHPDMLTRSWHQRRVSSTTLLTEIQSLKGLLAASIIPPARYHVLDRLLASMLKHYLYLNGFAILDILDDIYTDYIGPR